MTESEEAKENKVEISTCNNLGRGCDQAQNSGKKRENNGYFIWCKICERYKTEIQAKLKER